MANNDNGCPHCGNRIGFAFGTCVQCGFNYIDHTFHKIEVWAGDIPADLFKELAFAHACRTARRE